MTAIEIRPYRPADQRAIETITYRTGYNGADLTGRRYFDDRRLFYLIFIAYYPRFEPQHCFVAEDQDSRQVVGFICGTPDTHAQELRFQKKIMPRILLRAIGVTSWRYPRTFANLLRMTRQQAALPSPGQSHQIQSSYPAHLHINLMPGHQGQGSGSRLMLQFEAQMRRCGVSGIHLMTSNKNVKALPFYRKMGYTVIHESGSVPHPEHNDLKFLVFAKQLT